MREVERIASSMVELTQHCQRLFRALKEAQLTKMDLSRSDPEAIDRMCGVLMKWQERAMCHSNDVQKFIISKAAHCPDLGPFDFIDLDCDYCATIKHIYYYYYY